MHKSLLLFLMSISLLGCTTATKTCINERTNKTIIRWGDYITKTGAFKGYEYHAEDLHVYTVTSENRDSKPTLTIVDTVYADVYCNRLNAVIEGFTEIQSLHSPGIISRSVEYVNEKTNVHKKAIWNPAFATFGSKEFRTIYDSLMLSVPVKNIWPTVMDSTKQ